MIAHVIERAQLIQGVDCVIVATCPDNDELVALSKEFGAETFVGSESDVLERYTLAAREFGGDFIVRITGDNPFTDVEYGSMAVQIACESMSDLTSISGLPLGCGVEVIRRESLEECFRDGKTPYHREHVTPYIKEHPELFSIQRHLVSIPFSVSNMRLTVDTPQDFQLAEKIYSEIYKGSPFSMETLLAFLSANPDLLEINKNISQRPMTHSENPA